MISQTCLIWPGLRPVLLIVRFFGDPCAADATAGMAAAVDPTRTAAPAMTRAVRARRDVRCGERGAGRTEPFRRICMTVGLTTHRVAIGNRLPQIAEPQVNYQVGAAVSGQSAKSGTAGQNRAEEHPPQARAVDDRDGLGESARKRPRLPGAAMAANEASTVRRYGARYAAVLLLTASAATAIAVGAPPANAAGTTSILTWGANNMGQLGIGTGAGRTNRGPDRRTPT